MKGYLWIAAVAVCLVGLEEGWWTFSDLLGMGALMGVVLWFLLFMAGIESAREASEQPPAREASEQRTAARARRRIRDDINQAGRDDWDDASDE